MWLWKKFWNTDIIGKIYILIILFIIIVATITVITRYKNASTNQIENEQKNEIIGEENEIIGEEITFESNVIDNNVTTVANIKEDTKEEITEQNIKDITKQNIETKVQENATIKTSSTLSSNKTTENQDKKDDVQEDTKDEKNTNLEETKEEIIEEPSKLIPIEEYKVNNDMINKMKQTINNNKTEDMINFGYEVAVDSSIVTKTNYFTYSDVRLISKLTYRFGTIRIYARDLYVNGEYAHTECFIY